MREALWILGCLVVATVVTWRVEPEYGNSPLCLPAALLYAATGAIRLIARWRADH